MKYFKDFKKLCTPASVYLFINVIIFISIAIQNFGNTTQYCVGQYKCHVPNTFSMFLFKALYILFWTFILNAICKAGYKEVSWFMVLLPIILLFIIIGIVILNSGSVSIYEGFKEGMGDGGKGASVTDGGNVTYNCSEITTETSCNPIYCTWDGSKCSDKTNTSGSSGEAEPQSTTVDA